MRGEGGELFFGDCGIEGVFLAIGGVVVFVQCAVFDVEHDGKIARGCDSDLCRSRRRSFGEDSLGQRSLAVPSAWGSRRSPATVSDRGTRLPSHPLDRPRRGSVMALQQAIAGPGQEMTVVKWQQARCQSSSAAKALRRGPSSQLGASTLLDRQQLPLPEHRRSWIANGWRCQERRRSWIANGWRCQERRRSWIANGWRCRSVDALGSPTVGVVRSVDVLCAVILPKTNDGAALRVAEAWDAGGWTLRFSSAFRQFEGGRTVDRLTCRRVSRPASATG